MIEFDVNCRRCEKLITLRVRDEQAHEYFLKHGALCQACYESQPVSPPAPKGR